MACRKLRSSTRSVFELFTQLALGPQSDADSFKALPDVIDVIAAQAVDDMGFVRMKRAPNLRVGQSMLQDAAEFYNSFIKQLFPAHHDSFPDWDTQHYRHCNTTARRNIAAATRRHSTSLRSQSLTECKECSKSRTCYHTTNTRNLGALPASAEERTTPPWRGRSRSLSSS